MSFISPHLLLTLLVLPLGVWLYVRGAELGRAEGYALYTQTVLLARAGRAAFRGRRWCVGLYGLGLSWPSLRWQDRLSPWRFLIRGRG